MSTAEELTAQIAAAQRELQEKKRQKQRFLDEVVQANERQRLRRALERVQAEVGACEGENRFLQAQRAHIDRDVFFGDHLPEDEHVSARPNAGKAAALMASGKTEGQVMNCEDAITKGEFTWKIEGVSWLEHTLKQTSDDEFLESEIFTIGGESFVVAYHPKGGSFNSSQRGSLAIIHWGDEGITFRYRVFIKRGADFIQWGETGDECHPDSAKPGRAFGPDVQSVKLSSRASTKPIGIFGLTHKELVQSEYVSGDTLIARFEFEVRPPEDLSCSALKAIQVPPPTMSANFLSLLEEEKCWDVVLLVGGESIKAHSQILSARSEVFGRLFGSGMSESVTKQITIEDCSAVTFNALLRFLYTDDFSYVEELLKAAAGGGTSSSSNGNSCGGSSGSNSGIDRETQFALLQNVLAVAHKYQVSRLSSWCERQICERITVSNVCEALCQANLFQAKELVDAGLEFIKKNMAAVVVTPAFGGLAKQWPEVMLKISMFTAGVTEASGSAAFEGQRETSDGCLKRKRREEDDDAEGGSESGVNEGEVGKGKDERGLSRPPGMF